MHHVAARMPLNWLGRGVDITRKRSALNGRRLDTDAVSPANEPVFSKLIPAILMRIGAGILTVLMAVLVRLLTPHLPVGEIVFGRSIGALLLILATLAIRGEAQRAFQTHRPLAQVIRGITGSVAMALNFLALTYLSIAETQAIMYTSPLFTLLIAAVVLGHSYSWLRWVAVAIGFGGTVLILGADPLSATHASLFGAGIAVVGAALTAAALLQVRSLARTETTTSITAYFALTATVLSLVTFPSGWIWPTLEQLILLLSLAALGALAHLLLTHSLAKAEPSVLAPFEFLNIVWAIGLGAVLFDERIGAMSLAGATMIIGASFAVTVASQPPAVSAAAEATEAVSMRRS